jgi:hypothetical protein
MKKKFGIITISILIFVSIIFSTSLTSAQSGWNYCKIDAYGTNLNDYSDSSTNSERYEFTVATPPSGSEITNTIEVSDFSSGENFTETLTPGQVVYYNYQGSVPSTNRVTAASEAGFWILEYEGDITDITIDNTAIPEFSSIIILPLFITVTLLAIIYRRKHTLQKQNTE